MVVRVPRSKALPGFPCLPFTQDTLDPFHGGQSPGKYVVHDFFYSLVVSTSALVNVIILVLLQRFFIERKEVANKVGVWLVTTE